MKSDFYILFENQFRGSRELIRSRLDEYKSFFEPLAKRYPHSQALDIGCGRGECLELLSGYGFEVKGVDLDNDMIECCKELHLNATKCDGIKYLSKLESNSHSIITALHVVEHMPFELMMELIG